jgi:phosphoribosyl 1,2-cyclic phosphodiesterase
VLPGDVVLHSLPMHLPPLAAPRRNTPNEEAITATLSKLAIELQAAIDQRRVVLEHLGKANTALERAQESDKRVGELRVALASLVVAARKLSK